MLHTVTYYYYKACMQPVLSGQSTSLLDQINLKSNYLRKLFFAQQFSRKNLLKYIILILFIENLKQSKKLHLT